MFVLYREKCVNDFYGIQYRPTASNTKSSHIGLSQTATSDNYQVTFILSE